MTTPAGQSRTAEIRRLARTDAPAAETLLAALIRDLFAIEVSDLAINRDQYSLNSLNGFFASGADAYFFKFHQEEGEEAMSGEYYRADILARAGLPVDQPVFMSTLPGEQILIYRRRADPRFSDVLRGLEISPDPVLEDVAVAAEARLSGEIARVYLATLHPVTAADVASEPIHRLFFDRMVDRAGGSGTVSRFHRFYVDRTFVLPGATLSWTAFSTAALVINGQRYTRTIGELFSAATRRLSPERLADAGGVTAHGDAHNANVWFTREGAGARLAFFDPAFAGAHVPSLLAEVKATFHNVFAHPFWLYDPDEADRRYRAEATYRDGVLAIDTDHRLSPVRQRLLDAKAEAIWRPLIRRLDERGLLPADWETVVRLGLFLSPTLVMNLCAGAATHNPVSSAIGFAVAAMVGSPPVEGEDPVTRFFAMIDPRRG